MTRSNPSKLASKKSKVTTPSPKLFRRKQDITPKPLPPPDPNVLVSTPPTKGITTILDQSPPTKSHPTTCGSTPNLSSPALLTKTPSTQIALTNLPIEDTTKPSVLTVALPLTTQEQTTLIISEHPLTPNPISFTLTTLDHRITTLQHRHEHDFSVITKQTGLPDMKSETPSVHQLICVHIDAYIQKKSSVMQIKPIRHYSKFVERYINKFIDP